MARISFRRLRSTRAQTWISWSYFCYFGGVGCFIPYLPLYYRRLGLSGLQLGVLTAILPLGIAFVAPLWGSLADTYAAHRAILRGAFALAALTALGVASVTSFVALVPLMLLLAVFLAAIPALIDSYAVTISDREGGSFGRLRVWGSIGFILAVWLVAVRMGDQVSRFFIFAYAATLLLGCAGTFGLPRSLMRSSQPLWQGVAAIVRDRSVAVLLLAVYVVTSNATVMMSYLGIYLTEIGGTARLVGMASALAAISEVPVMVLGRRLIERFGSRNMFILAVVVYLTRFVLYSIPASPSWVLLIQLLHGLSFGVYLMSSVTLVYELAGRNRAATAQGLLSSTSLGFGAITGSLVGGALLDRIGAVGIFRVAAVGMVLALASCLVTLRLVVPAQPGESDTPEPGQAQDRAGGP